MLAFPMLVPCMPWERPIVWSLTAHMQDLEGAPDFSLCLCVVVAVLLLSREWSSIHCVSLLPSRE